MLIPPNEALTVVNPVWIEHSNRDNGFVVACPIAIYTLCIDHMPTVLVKRLTVALTTDTIGSITIRKWFLGGTQFIDEAPVAAVVGSNLLFSDTLLETCQILFTPAGAPALVSVTAIGRS